MPEDDPNLPEDVATVVNPSAWIGRVQQLALLLSAASRQPTGLKVVSDPAGISAVGSPDVALVSDPTYWSSNQAALAEALVEPAQASASRQSTSCAVSEGVNRLTLTVEEAAASLGISRASAYEAVRRGDIPAIRIGRRILSPGLRWSDSYRLLGRRANPNSALTRVFSDPRLTST
jgi:excisionase family DNA binding protein